MSAAQPDRSSMGDAARDAEIIRLGQRIEYLMKESDAMRVMARQAMNDMYALIKQRPQGPAA